MAVKWGIHFLIKRLVFMCLCALRKSLGLAPYGRKFKFLTSGSGHLDDTTNYAKRGQERRVSPKKGRYTLHVSVIHPLVGYKHVSSSLDED